MPRGIYFFNAEPVGGYNSAVYSESWSSVGPISPTNQWTSAAWSPSLELFCIGATHNPTYPELDKFATSPDGVNWTQRDHGATYPNIYDLIWSEDLGLFISCGQNTSIYTSPDGINWTQNYDPVEMADVDDLTGICYSPSLGMIVAVGWNDNHAVLTSSDGGSSWTSYATPGATYVWNDVCWSPSLGIFCACANWAGASNERFMTSSDGVNWTLRSAATASQFQCIDWSEELGLFVAAGGSVIETSPDGINWTSRTPALPQSARDVIWVSQLGRFFICNLSSSVISSSTNGIDWSNISLNNTYSWYGMSYSPPLKKLIVVAANFVTDNIEVSTAT